MEDALALKAQVKEQMRQFGVLILVLMEDALAQFVTEPVLDEYGMRLNPCFNGRCTRTRKALSTIRKDGNVS